jgi:hypothetical protein
MADRIVAFRKHPGDAEFFDISYEEFTAHPVGVLRRLYAFLGRALRLATEQRITRLPPTMHPGRFGRRVYRLSDFGVNPAQLQDRFREYSNWFSLPRRSHAASNTWRSHAARSPYGHFPGCALLTGLVRDRRLSSVVAFWARPADPGQGDGDRDCGH